MVYGVLSKGSSLRQFDSRIRASFREKVSIYEMETSLFLYCKINNFKGDYYGTRTREYFWHSGD